MRRIAIRNGAALGNIPSLVLSISCWAVVLLVLSCLVILSSFGDIDDAGLLRMLERSAPDIFDLQPSRFQFVIASIYLLISLFGKSAYVFFGFKFIAAMLSCWVVLLLCSKLTIKRPYASLLVLFVVLQPPFVFSSFKLSNSEWIGFPILLIITYLLVSQFNAWNEDRGYMLLKRILHGLIIMLLSLVFVFLRESHFILLFTFSLTYFIIIKVASDNTLTCFPGFRFVFAVFVGSSLLFLLVYYLTMIMPEASYTNTNYISHNMLKEINANESITFHISKRIAISAFNLLTYSPIYIAVSICVLIRLIYRREYLFRAKQMGMDGLIYWVDSLLVTSTFFGLFYIIFGLSSPRYFLPSYAFLIPCLCVYSKILFSSNSRGISLWTNSLPSLLRYGIVIVVALFATNSVLTGINILVRTKYIPINVTKMAKVMLPYVMSSSGKVKIYVIGIDPGIKEFLLLNSAGKLNISRIEEYNLTIPFNIAEKREMSDETPHPGNYIIVTPYSYKTNVRASARYIADEYPVVLLYKSSSKYYFQLPTLRTLMQSIYRKPQDRVDFYLYQMT